VSTVREAMFELMRNLDLTTVFGNPGSTEETFLENFPSDFHYVLGLHEASVVAMADGYTQNSGKPALVNLHTAAGMGNAMGNIASAWHNRAPLIILAGQQTREMLLLEPYLTNLQATQLPLPYVKWSYETARAEDAPAALMRAYAMAVQPPAGPVFLSIPMDDLDQPFRGQLPSRQVSRSLQVNDGDMRVTAKLLAEAKSPALIVGGAVDRDTGWDSVIRLAETLASPVWAAPQEGRPGFPETHPLFQGSAPAGIGLLSKAFEGHDLILVIGAPVFRYYPYVPGSYLPEGTRLIQIVDDPQEAARAPVGDSILADPGRACEVLADMIPQSTRPRPSPAAPMEKPEVKSTISPDLLFYSLNSLRPENSILVQESLSNLKMLRKRLPTSKRLSFFSMTSGVLGYGLPAAVGVALSERDSGNDRKVICIVGDGAAQYVIQSLWSAAQLKLPILFIVVRNGQYGILKAFAEFQETPAVPGLDLPGIDTVKLAQGYGCTAFSVTDPEELTASLRRGLEADGPCLIEVAVSAEVPPLT
jgi:benzoylformate decarboxylase